MSKGGSGKGNSGRGGKPKGTSGRGERSLKVRVKTAKGRRLSSTRWLERQLNDPYVQRAKAEGYRSRAAFKLLEMDEKHGFLDRGQTVIDLGAAPGGWCQVAKKKVGPEGKVIGIDIQEVEAIPDVDLICLDFMDDSAPDKLKQMAGGPVDVVMSDMAAFATGHKQTDHLRIMGLCEAALYFAVEVLAPDGSFFCKILQGGADHDLLTMLKQNFKTVKHVKPAASRADSAEMYLVAQGFKGRQAD